MGIVAALAVIVAVSALGDLSGQSYPNPYRMVDGWATLPGGRVIGAVGDATVDNDGRHIWAILRCDAGPERFGFECLENRALVGQLGLFIRPLAQPLLSGKGVIGKIGDRQRHRTGGPFGGHRKGAPTVSCRNTFCG